MPTDKLVDLKAEWDAIDSADGKLDDRKWALAARLAEENGGGRSTRELAAALDRNKSTVARWIQVHREFGAARGVSFAQGYDQVQGRTTEGETQLRSSPTRRRRSATRSSGEGDRIAGR